MADQARAGEVMSTKARTRLTKTGQPVLGTTIEVHHQDDTWEVVKVVGKGEGTRNRTGETLVMVMLEYDDGSRIPFVPLVDLTWRVTS